MEDSSTVPDLSKYPPGCKIVWFNGKAYILTPEAQKKAAVYRKRCKVILLVVGVFLISVFTCYVFIKKST